MAGTWTSERFPQFEADIRRLTEEHRELEDEPLHLAIAYSPAERDQQDIYLFEVIGGPMPTISSERDLFETTFGGASGFPLGKDEQLHLILTNSLELPVAIEQNWPLANEIVQAIRSNNYRKMFADPIGEQMMAQLHTAAAAR